MHVTDISIIEYKSTPRSKNGALPKKKKNKTFGISLLWSQEANLSQRGKRENKEIIILKCNYHLSKKNMMSD